MSSPEPVDVPLSSPELDIQMSSEGEKEKESEQELEELPPVDAQKEVQEG